MNVVLSKARVVAVGGVVLALLAWAIAAPAGAGAQEPLTPCPGVMLGTLPEDPSIRLLGFNATVEEVNPRDSPARPMHGADVDGAEQFTATWDAFDAAAGIECIWVGIRFPGVADHQGSGDFKLLGDTTSFSYSPAGGTGEYCFLFVPMTKEFRGPGTERCEHLKNPVPFGPTPPGRPTTTQVPTETESPSAGPSVQPGPPNTGSVTEAGDTNWPIVYGVLGGVIVLVMVAAFARHRRER